MTANRPPQIENRILANLPPADRERLLPLLEQVDMPRGQILYSAGDPLEHIYFPTGSMVSLVSQMSDGASVEVGVTGFEGVVGLSYLMGVDRSPHECMVQLPDGAMRARAADIRKEFKLGGAFQDLALRYTQMVLMMTSQAAACNTLHHIGERLARWLLMSHDRCQCDELPLTQEFLAMMIGVRRAGVTEAAILLQAEGLINYRRGHITITDREGLEDYACECYAILKKEFDQQMS